MVAWLEGTPTLVVFVMAVDTNSAKAGGRTTSVISRREVRSAGNEVGCAAAEGKTRTAREIPVHP